MYCPIISSRARAPLAAALLLTMTACSTDVLGPEPGTAPESAGKSIAARASTPGTRPSGLRPNALKYRDAGTKPATATAGSQSFSIRALLGRDGRTMVEATTGEFEAAPTGDVFTGLQVKHLVDGKSVTRVFNDVAGSYWGHEFEGILYDGPVYVQAKLQGPQGRGITVLDAMTQVVRRPDLVASGLSLPAAAEVDRMVTISAVIAEVNGDVGARTDCVLLVDGARMAASEGTWVDAGDAVTCRFYPTFATTGTKQVTVSAVGVAPGDWDDANNAVSGTIQVGAASTAQWSLQFEGDDRAYDYEMTYEANGVTRGWLRTGSSHYRSASLAATATGVPAFQGAVTFAATFRSGGLHVGDAAVATQVVTRPDMECHLGWDSVTNTSFRSCSYVGSPIRDLWVSHSSTRVTYFGEDVINGTGYQVADDDTSGFGAFAIGTSFGMEVKLLDATGVVLRTNATTPVSFQLTDMLCADQAWQGAVCTGYDRLTTYSGSASGS